MDDPIEGVLSIMRLDAYDIPYLSKIRLPAWNVADELSALNATANWRDG